MGSLPRDYIRRFLFEHLDVRGAVVRLGPAWQAMQSGRDYSPKITQLLGEMTAVAVLVAGNLKQAGRLTIQLQGSGSLRLLVIDASSRLGIRGMAQHVGGAASEQTPALLAGGRLTLTLQPDDNPRPYQSIVPTTGTSVAEVFEAFLAQSEQAAARLWLAADQDGAAGLFLQKLPGADQRDSDGWNRVQILADTVSTRELVDMPAVALLSRLFAEETLRVFDPRPVFHDCPEDWDKVRRLLRSLGRAEAEAIIAERGEIHIHDDICNRDYRFSADEVAVLFDGEAPRRP